MTDGWIKLHRKLTEWEWYNDTNTFKVFIHLLLTANHKPQKWRGVVIERGQKLTSRAKLADETRLSEQQVRTCLERLKSTSEITSQATNRNTVLTLCNYELYQRKETPTNQPINQPSTKQATSNQPTIKQEGKEGKEERGARAPSRAWKSPNLDEWLEYAAQIDFDRPGATSAFDHYEANGWRQKGGNRIADWKAACRTCNRRRRGTGTLAFSQQPANPPRREASPPVYQ